MAQTKHTAEWHLSTRNIYSAKFSLFLKLVYPSYTHCRPDIYPLYTWYIPIVYPSYTQAHQFRIEWAWNSLLVHQLHGIGCSGPSTETSFRIHKGIGIEVESSFHLQLWCSRKYSREFMAFQLHLRLRGHIFLRQGGTLGQVGRMPCSDGPTNSYTWNNSYN